jgi:hypothetical protein
MEIKESEIPEAHTLFAAALYLATNYARTGCPLLCNMVMRQLACIEHHPAASVSESTREACRKLRAEWERIGAERAHALREAARAEGREAQQLH